MCSLTRCNLVSSFTCSLHNLTCSLYRMQLLPILMNASSSACVTRLQCKQFFCQVVAVLQAHLLSPIAQTSLQLLPDSFAFALPMQCQEEAARRNLHALLGRALPALDDLDVLSDATETSADRVSESEPLMEDVSNSDDGGDVRGWPAADNARFAYVPGICRWASRPNSSSIS